MPTYDYLCGSCGEKFEFFQKMSDQPLTHCPECHGPLERLIGTGAGVIFKGSGSRRNDTAGRNTGEGCDRLSPCCGRAEPCERKPCE